VSGEVVELAALGGLPNLAIDPALEPDAGRLSLGHRLHCAWRKPPI
jgi:hypothetical protein